MAAATEALGGGSLVGVRVLVVDDTDDARQLFVALLSMFGMAVTEARSGREALHLFRQQRPSVVVSDIAMPDGDGLELVRALRALPEEEGRLTPAIAVSAHHDMSEAILAGFNVFLQKPVDPSRLVEVIRNFVDRGTRDAAAAAWTVHSPAPGKVVLTYRGYVTAADSEAAVEALVRHLERGPADVIADLRGLTGFDPAATLRGQWAAWSHRGNISSVRVVGGSALVRMLTLTAARVLGIPATASDEP